MHTRPVELTGQPDLEHERRTGPFRTHRPVYVDMLPPCNHACPAGENIQAWLAHAEAGRFEDAWRQLVQDNPMPAVHGRVCYHPCEGACNRVDIDSSVSIHGVERFLGDLALEKGWHPRPSAALNGKRVLIVGGGPSGLSAAYHLRMMGHQPVIYEAGPIAGGMMHFGIPSYRLPRDVLNAEIGRIEAMGVEIVLNRKVSNVTTDMRDGGFDAVFIAVGAHLSKRTDIPARDAGKMLDAISFLKDVQGGTPPKLGRRVMIYGGGNTAMDAARVAKRLGIDEAMIVYRRDREHMPAHDFEADEALAEGVKIHWLRTIKDIQTTNFTVEEMEIDGSGRPQPTGRYETLEADSLILALGQDTETEFLREVDGIAFERDGTVIVGSNMMTGHEGIFAGGDMVPSERTVTVAVGHGKKAARHIDAYLRGTTYEKPPVHDRIDLAKLHLWYHTDAPQQQQDELPAKERSLSFAEVVAGLSCQEAVYEAKRCLSCGNCFECDGCYGACPEDAIIKLGVGKRYRIDYARCTGCAACYEQCPCHAIELIEEAA